MICVWFGVMWRGMVCNAFAYARTPVRLHACTCVCVFVCECTCVCMCPCVCVRVSLSASLRGCLLQSSPKADSLLFPGVPTEKRPAICFGHFRILSDINKKAWRVCERGVRVDTPFSWRRDAEDAWRRCADFVRKGDARRSEIDYS